LERRISELRSLADKADNMGEQEAHDGLDREKRRLFKELTSGLLHLNRDSASYPVKALHELGASAICLGYPLSAAREEGNELTVNLWFYRKLMDAVKSRAQEYGVKALEVVEHGTSKQCAYHGGEVQRYPRGVVSCPSGHKQRSDLNGALNILKKATNSVVSTVRRTPSFLVDQNTVAPVKGCNPRDLGEPSPFRAERRSGEGPPRCHGIGMSNDEGASSFWRES
ncbi:MAG: zinc ribbon domain-containing protein, partial [Candidatus Marsarchaeota archaeon]